MYQEQFYRQPVRPQSHPASNRPMEVLKKCRCGRMTFLDFPCDHCGGIATDPILQSNLHSEQGFARRMYLVALLGGLCLTVAGWFLSWIAGLCFLICTIAVTVLLTVQLRSIPKEDRYFYWQFNREWKPLLRGEQIANVLDDSALEPILDAWYLDMDHLDRLAFAGEWTEVLRCSRLLAGVFRNNRLSRLQLQALLQLPDNTAESYDLDEICAHLTDADIPDDQVAAVLNLMASASAFGGCMDHRNLPELFTRLLARYLELLRENNFTYAEGVSGLHGVLGDELFTDCGGRLQNGVAMIPDEPEACADFYRLLVLRITANRAAYVDNGGWYPLMECLNSINHPGAAKALRHLQACFFNRTDEKTVYRVFQQRSKERKAPASIQLLLDEQKDFFAGALRFWQTDGSGRPLTRSSCKAVRDLMQATTKNYRWEA